MTLEVAQPLHPSNDSFQAPLFGISDSKTCAAHVVEALDSMSTAGIMQFSALVSRRLLKDCNEKRRELDTGGR